MTSMMLSIHHLTDAPMAQLFRNGHCILIDGGVFINADPVRGATPAIDRCFREILLNQVKDRGVSDEPLNKVLKRMKEGKMATLEIQLSWLKEASSDAVVWVPMPQLHSVLGPQGFAKVC